jgi:hypothetical protein
MRRLCFALQPLGLLTLLLALAGASPARAQPPAEGEAEVVVHGDRAFAIFPDGRVAHRRASDATWTRLPALALCAPARRVRGAASLATVTSDGTLWVAHGGCVSRWNGSHWISERVSLGAVGTLASVGNEVVIIAQAPDSRGDSYVTSFRSLHGSGRGWRLFELPSSGSGQSYDLTRLGARAPDDVVLVGAGVHARDAGLLVDRSYRFDGRRWSPARALREAVRDAVQLPDGSLFALGEEGSLQVGWPGSSWTPLPSAELTRAARIEGTPEEFWTALFTGTERRPQPGGIQHWRGGTLVSQVAFDARGVRRFGEQLLAWDRVGVHEVRDGRAQPIALPSAPVASWPSPTQAEALGLAPVQPALVFRSSAGSAPATLTSRATAIQVGSARVALIATPADVPGVDCPVEHQFSLVRLEGDRIAARQPVGPPSCGVIAPLVEASLEALDVDGDGRIELLARFPAQARGLEVAMLAIIDPDGLRVEGAFVTDLRAQMDTRQSAVASARLYLQWDVDAAGQTITRTPAVWNLDGARGRAPRLSPCRRDPARDVWDCTGDLLDAAVVPAAARAALALPVAVARTP